MLKCKADQTTHNKIATTSSTWRPSRRLKGSSNVQMPNPKASQLRSMPTIQLARPNTGPARAAPVKSALTASTCNSSRCNSSSSPLSAGARPHVMRIVPLASVSNRHNNSNSNSSRISSPHQVAKLDRLRRGRLLSSRCNRLKSQSVPLKRARKNSSVLVS